MTDTVPKTSEKPTFAVGDSAQGHSGLSHGLRTAVVGAGFMGATHARAIRASGGRVAWVIVNDPHLLVAAQRTLHADEATTDLAAVLADESIDVVHVCTPNDTHADIASAVLAAGKPVVCEKPLATDGDRAAALARQAADRQVITAVPFVYRFHPMVREMRARMRSGQPGELSVAHGSYLQDWLASPDDDNWRVDPDAGGRSRAFADIGSHWCDLFEFVSGDVITEVSAQLRTVFPRRGGHPVRTEDAASVHFRTRSGLLGTMVVSQTAAGRKNRLHLELSGSNSSFAFDQEESERLWIGRRDGSIAAQRDPATLDPSAARYAFLPAGHPQGYQDSFNAFVADAHSAAAGVVPDGLPTFADGARAARLCDAVLQSAQDAGAWTAPL
jgi:predicted dehydrogenase